ncbi:Hypothetical protein, putative [Bodo saltans]|uniref:Secreted protein n=1 Tax=Bodo saltans TaxID=75058 RepID=A0A0S4J4J8_BODSA|nr:Hypothetical protein, putative [Bodo saltans]|eukprot:CUG83061.1 Hypothetical protein, putative [Bodo saltans]
MCRQKAATARHTMMSCALAVIAAADGLTSQRRKGVAGVLWLPLLKTEVGQIRPNPFSIARFCGYLR